MPRLTYAAFWRGVNLISRDVAKLPLFVYRRVEDGRGKDRDRAHPAFRLLRRAPNNEMTAGTFKQTLTSHAITHGNGYAYIFRRGDGSPEEILPLNPEATYPVRENRILWYVTTVDMEQVKLRPENVIHLKGLGFDGLEGYPLITLAADSLALGIAARDYGGRFFKNSARPSVLLETPKRLTPQAAEKLRQSWNRLHQGLDNSHRTAVLEEGLQAKLISASARDSQLIETRQFEIRDIANWLNLPPHKLGDDSRTAYNSLEQENLSYLQEALDPWLCTWEEECYEKLLTESEKDGDTHFIEFERKGLLRADIAARTDHYTAALQNGWMNRDEVRALENMNPIPDGSGQTFLVNLTMGDPSGDEPIEEEENSLDLGALRRSCEEILADVVVRTIRRISAKGLQMVTKPVEQWRDWHQRGIVKHNKRALARDLEPVLRQAVCIGGAGLDADSCAGEVIDLVQSRLPRSNVGTDSLTLALKLEQVEEEAQERIVQMVFGGDEDG